MSPFVSSILWFVLGGVVGAAIGFFLARKSFTQQLKENPPVSEKMIRAMFLHRGRKPSEAQIKQVMKSMNQQQ